MKPCIDCKHASFSLQPYCYHPANAYDFVNGGTRVVPCDVARSGWSLSSDCDAEGRRFEPREYEPEAPPAWRRFVDRFLAVVKALRGGAGSGADVVGRRS